MNETFHEASKDVSATEERRRIWTRPCLQRMRAGSAEQGASSTIDFIDAKS